MGEAQAAAGANWTRTVTLPANTAVEYKFIKKNTDGSVTWESGANRILNTATTSQMVNTSWK
ncbi:carbohydrate-binding module family 20 domain-containing protein [Dactylosporangium sp. CA-233914]|uniref:carbohydrate-binding module family 20 domain-containing protein n=1 Tax=Dactylosporangium sp. CA-233914 TaxID=3239934 RepID=UPI003D89B765